MDTFNKLREEILQCSACKEFLTDMPKPIVQGTIQAKIMQIGQAPSKQAMERGKAFCDPSGKKLIHNWYKISEEEFYNEQNFYISSMARCFPGKSKNKGDNKPPKQCAEKFLNRELAFVQPQLYIVIGSYAAKWFFPDENMTTLIFKNHTYKGKPLFVIPHPSPLNWRWQKAYPSFENKRIVEIRNIIHQTIR